MISYDLIASLTCISTALLVLNIPQQCELPRGLPHMNRNIENASKPAPPPPLSCGAILRSRGWQMTEPSCCSNTAPVLALYSVLSPAMPFYFYPRSLLYFLLLYFSTSGKRENVNFKLNIARGTTDPGY